MRRWFTLVAVFLAFALPGKSRERIVFDLKFGIIKSGEAIMVITDTIYNGNKAVNYHLRGRTTGFMGKLYKVNDIYESTVDAQTYLPYRAVRNVREQNYRYLNEAFFIRIKTLYTVRKQVG